MKPQTSAKKYLEFTPEETKRVLESKQRSEAHKIKVTPEDMLLAELGMNYGFEAMLAANENRMDRATADKLVEASKRLWNRRMTDLASVIYIATGAANSGKKGGQVLNKGMQDFIKQSGVDV